MHGIDYFCLIYKCKLSEIAQILGIKQSAINGWKNGTKNFPDHHKKKLYELFVIPESKFYLLEVRNLNSIDKAEIELIYNEASLANAKKNSLNMVVYPLELNIVLLKRQIRLLKLLREVKLEFNLSITDEESFQLKMNELEKVLKNLRKL